MDTLSGGEPFCQPEACTEIAIYAKQLGLNVGVILVILMKNY